MRKFHLLNRKLIEQVTSKAAGAARKRINYNFHQLEDSSQRMLNAIEPESYVCPHRHVLPPKDEGFIILQGKGAVIFFDEKGAICDTCILDPATGQWGVDIPSGWYHTILSLEKGSVFYEAKTGPYVPSTDKDFAPWAPREGNPIALEYLQWLRQSVLNSIGAATS